jgi:flagellar assembly protein FliH
MSSQIIPKERLSAYQRWEMGAFEMPAETGRQARDGQASVILPTAEQVERIHQQAHEEGYAAGYEEGRHKAASEAAQFEQLLGGLRQSMAEADQTLCTDLLALSLNLAKQMVREALKVRPELVLALVRENIRDIPSFKQPDRLFLNPDDVSLVQNHMADELNAWTVCAEPSVARGGCRIETAGSQIDASLQTRWQRLSNALGQTNGWLD